jgi:hypothetical protein
MPVELAAMLCMPSTAVPGIYRDQFTPVVLSQAHASMDVSRQLRKYS